MKNISVGRTATTAMNDMLSALMQEVADFINQSESRLMASAMQAASGGHYTMAVFYRHRPEDLLTVDYKGVLFEFGHESGGVIAIYAHACSFFTTEPPAPRRSAEISFDDNPCAVILKEEAIAKLNPVSRAEFRLEIYKGNPQTVLEWALTTSADWLLPRIPFKSV